MDVVSRHLELLRLEGLSVSHPEIVKQLSQKYACAESTIYNDFETRATWQRTLQGINKADDVLLKVINRNEEIYHQASIRLLNSRNPSVQLGALNIMLKANSSMFDTAVLPSIMCKLTALEKKVATGVFVP